MLWQKVTHPASLHEAGIRISSVIYIDFQVLGRLPTKKGLFVYRGHEHAWAKIEPR